mgnify:CR=1 FL=1
MSIQAHTQNDKMVKRRRNINARDSYPAANVVSKFGLESAFVGQTVRSSRKVNKINEALRSGEVWVKSGLDTLEYITKCAQDDIRIQDSVLIDAIDRYGRTLRTSELYDYSEIINYFLEVVEYRFSVEVDAFRTLLPKHSKYATNKFVSILFESTNITQITLSLSDSFSSTFLKLDLLPIELAQSCYSMIMILSRNLGIEIVEYEVGNSWVHQELKETDGVSTELVNRVVATLEATSCDSLDEYKKELDDKQLSEVTFLCGIFNEFHGEVDEVPELLSHLESYAVAQEAEDTAESLYLPYLDSAETLAWFLTTISKEVRSEYQDIFTWLSDACDILLTIKPDDYLASRFECYDEGPLLASSQIQLTSCQMLPDVYNELYQNKMNISSGDTVLDWSDAEAREGALSLLPYLVIFNQLPNQLGVQHD